MNDTPFQRLISEIDGRDASPSGKTDGMPYDPDLRPWQSRKNLEAGEAFELVDQLRERLDHANEVFAGIGSAVDRHALVRIGEIVNALDSQRATEARSSQAARERLQDLLDGARELRRRQLEDLHRADTAIGAQRQNVELAAYARELEATLRRVRPQTADRLIASCASRATPAEIEEPF